MANAATKKVEPDHGFSEEDIWHAMRFWGCDHQHALNALIAEEARFRDDD